MSDDRDTPAPQDGELASADLAKIMRMIPHRAPFLFIDRVHSIDPGKSAIGVKNVTANEPHFAGHFPGKPIMPGVLIVEAMAQTAATMVVETLGMIDKGMLVYFMTVDRTKFRAPVVPGDVLELHVNVQRHKRNVWRFDGRGVVAGTLCAEAEFSAMIVDPE